MLPTAGMQPAPPFLSHSAVTAAQLSTLLTYHRDARRCNTWLYCASTSRYSRSRLSRRWLGSANDNAFWISLSLSRSLYFFNSSCSFYWNRRHMMSFKTKNELNCKTHSLLTSLADHICCAGLKIIFQFSFLVAARYQFSQPHCQTCKSPSVLSK